MDFVKLLAVFAAFIALLKWKKPLYLAAILCSLLTMAVYLFSPGECLRAAAEALCAPRTLTVTLLIYLLSVLQHLMDQRSMFQASRRALSGLCASRRVSAMVIPMFAGLLPAPSSVVLAAQMMEKDLDGYLSTEEKAAVASFYRHIPEAWLPTYAAVILATQLTGISIPSFLLWMAPMALVMMGAGYLFYLRRLPRGAAAPGDGKAPRHLLDLFLGLWPILLLLGLILFFGVSVQAASGAAVLALLLVGRFGPSGIAAALREAVVPHTLLGTYFVMVFSSVLVSTGVLGKLPEVFGRLPVPAWLTFALLFFVATAVGGIHAVIPLMLPLAFAAVPGAGVLLLVLLLTFGHSAMQISPTHICLFIACGHYGIPLERLVRKTLPLILCLDAAALVYYLLLTRCLGMG